MTMVWHVGGHENTRASMLTIHNKGLIPPMREANLETDFQNGDRQPEVVFYLRFLRHLSDIATEMDCSSVAESVESPQQRAAAVYKFCCFTEVK
jgi:EAL domain-containing protein (putative c-di-GMP-specific phosphodiesterase class I)